MVEELLSTKGFKKTGERLVGHSPVNDTFYQICNLVLITLGR